jgi:uncharacterized protein
MTRKCRVVVDTNVIVSFFSSARLDELVMSEAILAELHEVCGAPDSIATCREHYVRNSSSRFRAFATTVPIARSKRVCDDPSDDKFLEAAVDGGAQFLVTGDGALLAMKTFHAVEIVTPSAYLRARLQRL